MATKIKLMRLGKMRAPYYRIVVADARTKRDGRSIETIGEYHPKSDPSVIKVDGDRVVTFANHYACELLGYSNAELVGQGLDLIVPPEWHDAVRQRIDALRGQVDGLASHDELNALRDRLDGVRDGLAGVDQLHDDRVRRRNGLLGRRDGGGLPRRARRRDDPAVG